MDVPDATGRTGVSALDPSPLFLPSSPDLGPTISYIHIYMYVCACAWTRTGQGKVVKRRGGWHFPSYCWRGTRTCPVFSGQGMHLAARTTGLEGRGCSAGSNTGNWVNLGSRGIEGARNWDSIEKEGEVIGMWEWWKGLVINLSFSLLI